MLLISRWHTMPIKWSFVWWFFRAFALPITLPLVILHHWNTRKFRTLRGKLEGRVVLITGASSGLGEALAHAFYKAGCRLILCARREKELERVRDVLLQMYQMTPTYPPVVLPMDMSNSESVLKQAGKALSIFGHIDILINNAGVSYRGKISNTNIDVDAKLMAVNYLGPVTLVKALLPSMVKKREGHIVAVSSVQGLIGIPYRSAYAASKHALQAFHDVLRAEISHHNIRVTVISPGYIKTNLSVNAITENGDFYNLIDPTTANGQEPMKVAEILLQCVVNEKKDLIVAPLISKLAVIIRHLCPEFYFLLMARRAKSYMCHS